MTLTLALQRQARPTLGRIRRGTLFFGRQRLVSTLVADVVLNRDLYYASEYVHSNQKVAYKHEKPSLYPRFATEPPLDRNVHLVKNTRLISVLEGKNKQLEDRIRPRTEAVKALVGPRFELLTRECIAVLCGLSDVDVSLAPAKKALNMISSINSSKLRQIGKSVYDLTRNTTFIFSSEQYLSSATEEIASSVNLLDDDKTIIPMFMKRNLIFDCLLPFRGTMRSGPLEPEESAEVKERIARSTAIGSFHTLLGLLIVKYGKTRAVEEFIIPRVLNGQSGIVSIVTELSQGQRAT